MKNEKVLNTIEEAIEDFRQGKIVIVVDDEDRENEGDFIIAAEKATLEIVNFMLKNGRGVLCAPLSEERCAQLELNMMEPNNTSLLGTPFTVTVDLLGEGCTTGVSIHDRAATLRALADPKTKPSDLGRPGHINPLRARQKGVLRRPGHTEAAVDLARLAGLQPAGALIEIMNEDGSMARLPQLLEVAEKYGLKIISIADLIAYRLRNESIVERGETAEMPTEYGMFKITVFRQKSNGLEHMVLTKGEWTEDEPVRSACTPRAPRATFGIVPLRLRRTAPRSDAHDRKRGQGRRRLSQPGRTRHRTLQQDRSLQTPGRRTGHGGCQRAPGLRRR